jgi:hypothetical protein
MALVVRELIIGPILKRADGFVFDTWIAGEGLRCGYPYRRIEDAHYARNAMIRAAARSRGATICQTLDEFIAGSATGTMAKAA